MAQVPQNAPQNLPQAAFDRALDSFKKDLTKRDRDSFKITTFQDLQKSIDDLQKKHHSPRRLHDLSRLWVFLEAIEQYTKVVDPFCNSNEIVAFVLGPFKLLLQIASSYQKAFQELINIYEDIGENLPLLLQYQELFRTKPHMVKVLLLIYEDILKFHRLALRYFQRRVWKQLFDATWPSHTFRFSAIINNFRKHQTLIERQATLAQIEDGQAARLIEEDRFEVPTPLVRSYTRWNLRSLRAEDYTVGIVCALPLELFAVRALFDQTHPDLSLSPADSNHYALGRIGRHKVVAACLPDGEYGTNSAAGVATNLRRSFLSVKFCLLVGIGGGVPSSRNDIRLGDVVVSKPTGGVPGVIQYDMGKALENGFFELNGFLQAPPRLVMTALSGLKSDPHLPQAPLQEYIEEITICRKEYRYPGSENDRLFSSLYTHNPNNATCDLCSVAHATWRPSRSDHQPQIHYGVVASGNKVIKDAKLRDRWSMEKNVLCFEMEAAGIMNTLPCLVIRGICDYSDSHKDKRFQQYAAATAASYAKLLLCYMKSSQETDEMTVSSNKQDGLLGTLRKALYFLP